MFECRPDDTAPSPHTEPSPPLYATLTEGFRNSLSTFYGFVHHCFCRTLLIQEFRFTCTRDHVFEPLAVRGVYDKDLYFMLLSPRPLGGYRMARSWHSDLITLREQVANVNKVFPRPKFLGVFMDMFTAKGAGSAFDTQVKDVKSVLSEVSLEIPIVCIPTSAPVKRSVFTEHSARMRTSFGDGYFSFWVGDVAFVVVDTSLWCHLRVSEPEFQAQLTWLKEKIDEFCLDELCRYVVVLQHRAWYVDSLEEPDSFNNIPLSRLRDEMVTSIFRQEEKIRAVFCVNRLFRDLYTKAEILCMDPTPLLKPDSAKLLVQVEGLTGIIVSEEEFRSGKVNIVVRLTLGEYVLTTPKRLANQNIVWQNCVFEFPNVTAEGRRHEILFEVLKTKFTPPEMVKPKSMRGGSQRFPKSGTLSHLPSLRKVTSKYSERILPPEVDEGASLRKEASMRKNRAVTVNMIPVTFCKVDVSELEPGLTPMEMKLQPVVPTSAAAEEEENGLHSAPSRSRSMLAKAKAAAAAAAVRKNQGTLNVKFTCVDFGKIMPTELVLFPDVPGLIVGKLKIGRPEWRFYEQADEVPLLTQVDFSRKHPPPPPIDSDPQELATALRELDLNADYDDGCDDSDDDIEVMTQSSVYTSATDDSDGGGSGGRGRRGGGSSSSSGGGSSSGGSDSEGLRRSPSVSNSVAQLTLQLGMIPQLPEVGEPPAHTAAAPAKDGGVLLSLPTSTATAEANTETPRKENTSGGTRGMVMEPLTRPRRPVTVKPAWNFVEVEGESEQEQSKGGGNAITTPSAVESKQSASTATSAIAAATATISSVPKKVLKFDLKGQLPSDSHSQAAEGESSSGSGSTPLPPKISPRLTPRKEKEAASSSSVAVSDANTSAGSVSVTRRKQFNVTFSSNITELENAGKKQASASEEAAERMEERKLSPRKEKVAFRSTVEIFSSANNISAGSSNGGEKEESSLPRSGNNHANTGTVEATASTNSKEVVVADKAKTK